MRYNRLYKENNFLTTTTYTQQLSEYVEGLKYEDLPEEVIGRAKLLLIHTVGAALAASGTDIAAKALKMAREANGGEGGPTTVWGSGMKLAAVNGALALGTMADALDLEAYSVTGRPAAGLIPCAWLAAEEKHKSGKELIAAIAAGYEVYQRIAMAVQPSEERRQEKGWGLTSWQIFACILPIAKLYGMDARKINQSIGMSCECSVLPTDYHRVTDSDFRSYEYGYRARDGFLIVKSVDRGINNQRDALDEPRCYTGVICGNDGKNGAGETLVRSEEADVTWLTRDLGGRWMILDSRFTAEGEDLTPEQIVDLFRTQAAGLPHAGQAAEALCRIEQAEDVAELAELLH